MLLRRILSLSKHVFAEEALGINEDELEQRQREYNDLQKELNDMSVEDAVEEEKLEVTNI